MARKQSKTSLVFAPRVIRAFLGSHGPVAARECFQPGRGGGRGGGLGLTDRYVPPVSQNPYPL